MKNAFLILFFFFTAILPVYPQGSWVAVPNAPVETRFEDICLSNDSTVFIAQDSRVYKSTDRGNTWMLVSVLDTTIQFIRSIEFINSYTGFAGILYNGSASMPGNLYKTVDGGSSWSLLQNMQVQLTDGICGMAHYGNTLIAVGTYSGPAWFYRSDDFGATWMKTDLSSIADGLVDCHMISADTILVSGVADSANQYKAAIFKSVDGGLTWNSVFVSPLLYTYLWKMFFRPGGLGVGAIESAGTGNNLIARTTDNGNTWTSVSINLSNPPADLGGIGMVNDTLGWAFDQHDLGSWETQDGGLTWNFVNTPVNKGDRVVAVDSLTLLAAGVTVFKYDPGTVGVNEPVKVNQRPGHTLAVHPNPSREKITVIAHAIDNTFGMLDLLDTNGKMVRRITRQLFTKGDNRIEVTVKELPAGDYFIVWHNNERLLSKQISIIK